MSNFDAIKLAVEGFHPNNTVLYDDMGMPSFMVRIPKFKISDVIAGGSNSTHPAFIVNGVEVPEIYIGKYQSIVENERAYSLPGQDPQASVTLSQAKTYCENKGKGWHLMSNAEWGALSLWCQKAGFLPRGNTNNGKDYVYTHERGVVTYQYTSDGVTLDGRTATGSGPITWAHDGSPDGIFDLCGNVWEWVSGLRLVNGQIQVIPDNNSAAGVDEGVNSTLWKAIGTNGILIEPDANGSLYFDSSVVGDDTKGSHSVGGVPVLSTERTNPLYTVEDVNDNYGYNYTAFKSLAAKEGVSVPEIVQALGLMPVNDVNGGVFFLRNYGERLPLRGGSFPIASAAGVCALNLRRARSARDTNFGFRAAFVNLQSVSQ